MSAGSAGTAITYAPDIRAVPVAGSGGAAAQASCMARCDDQEQKHLVGVIVPRRDGVEEALRDGDDL